jgi:hypothetical protein
MRYTKLAQMRLVAKFTRAQIAHQFLLANLATYGI